MTSLFDLSGRTALVTGSTRGLGRAMAFSLAEAGARVVLNYANDKERGLACQRSFEEAGHESLLVGASVIEEGNVDRLVSKVESEFGGVDILVVNATARLTRQLLAGCSVSLTGVLNNRWCVQYVYSKVYF